MKKIVLMMSVIALFSACTGQMKNPTAEKAENVSAFPKINEGDRKSVV